MDKADLAAQLIAGAARASGDILLFLHADSRLTSGCLNRINCISSQFYRGAFTMQLASNSFSPGLLALVVKFNVL